MAASVYDFFKERLTDNRNKFNKATGKLKLISWIRLVVFITLVVLVLYFANRSDAFSASTTGAFFFLLFIIFIKRYNKVKYRANHFHFLAQINSEELDRINNKLSGFDSGAEYISEDHPYAKDLDIFGNSSLFQLLNRCCTTWGKNTLARWLQDPAKKNEILNRQSAIRELVKDPDWIQDFQATGRHYWNKKDTSPFLKWLKSGNYLLGNNFYGFIRYLFPVINISLLLLVIFNDLNIAFFFLGIVVNAFILLSVLKRVNEVHQNTENGIATLKTVEALIHMIENRKFLDPGLISIQENLSQDGEPASHRIGKLKSILEQLDNRSNVFYQILNIGLLLDIHLTIAAEKWKSSDSGNSVAWLDTLGHLEALQSLASYAFANPEYVDPVLKENSFTIETTSMGHPLIEAAKRINNNFKLTGRGSIAMITGSNMAGKSTFLRTIGINLVLALAGAKVCAEKLTCGHIQVYTSMRTQDNLAENISSFYAELKRIQQLIEYTRMDTPILFLLDEILKGTNSKDRHLGAVSLVNQLAGKNAFGLISTHDLSLAKETMRSNHVENYSFNSTINGDEIQFDYKLMPGICESFNASKLMEKIGINLIR